MIFHMEVAIEEAEGKIGVREDAHGRTSDRSPLSQFFIIDGPGDDDAR